MNWQNTDEGDLQLHGHQDAHGLFELLVNTDNGSTVLSLDRIVFVQWLTEMLSERDRLRNQIQLARQNNSESPAEGGRRKNPANAIAIAAGTIHL